MAKAQTKQKKAAPKKPAAKPVKKVQKVIQKKVAKKVTRKVVAKKQAPTKKAPVKKAPVAKKVKKSAGHPDPDTAPQRVKKVVPKKKAAPAKKQIPKQAKAAKETKETKDTATSDKVLKPVKPKADPNKVPAKYASYTLAQYNSYLDAVKQWSSKTNQEIKDNLRKNFQSMTGNKDELLNKIADGIVLGQIPRCPNCFGGRPKYNQASGTYFCVGYRDDEDFKWCNKTISTLERAPWQL